jgi:RND family efflux transporter MFP subunit
MSHDALAPKPGRTPPLSGRKAVMLIAALIGLATVIAILGIVPRVRARTTLQQQTDLLAAPDVLVAPPALGNVAQEVVLPGNVQAFTDAPIFARTSGYLKAWSFDLGAHVKKGQRLAVIASPEVDQQLMQAKADVATAKANSKYAETQSTRYQDLLNENAVSKQDTDNFRAQANSTSNQVAAAEANVRRLAQLTGFESVVAPFDGVITARNVDLGTLVDAGAGRELFHLAADDVLRVYVNVPQIYSREMVPGQTAGLTVPEQAGRTFTGKIVRTASAIDPGFRTLLVEVEVDNHKHELFPGAYAQVHFKLARAHPTLVLPVPTLIFRTEGLRVAVVRNGQARLVPITIGRDDGKTVEVSQGLEASDLVIQNPPDSIIDGEAVHVVVAENDSRTGPGPAQAEAGHAGSKRDGAK